jgi:hypothetical protein
MNMSRSRKRTPICGMTNAASEKYDKRLYNRRYRRVCNTLIDKIDENSYMPLLREYSNVWAMNKDGKQWFDVNEFPEYII